MGGPKIEYFVRTEGERPRPREREGGKVDFYNLNLIENVVAGQVLARIPPGEEAVGPEVFPMGENVYVPEDNPRVLVAAVNGHAYWKDGLLHVSPEYVIEGNVDFSTGNVVFVGKLVVKGVIRAGFSVEAEELLVEGEVEGEVRTAGDMEVRGGIVGGDKGQVKCGGNLRAMYLLNARVEVEGDLSVEKSIRNSTVKVRGRAEVWGDPGVILGGTLQAGQGLKAKIIGARWGIATEIEVGTDPFLKGKLEELMAKRDRLRETVETGQTEGSEIQRELEELDEKIALLQAKMASEEVRAEVEATEGIYHGTKIVIKGITKVVTEDLMGHRTLQLQGDEVVIR